MLFTLRKQTLALCPSAPGPDAETSGWSHFRSAIPFCLRRNKGKRLKLISRHVPKLRSLTLNVCILQRLCSIFERGYCVFFPLTVDTNRWETVCIRKCYLRTIKCHCSPDPCSLGLGGSLARSRFFFHAEPITILRGCLLNKHASSV